MSMNGILPAEGARSSAVSQFIHPVTDTVSTPGLTKVSTTSLRGGKSSAARSRRGIGARISYSLAALTIVFWIFFAGTAFAQNDVGSIVGFVTDSSGAVVPNAKVIIKNEGTGESRTVSTDGSGHYAVPNLSPTVYTMTAEATGFQKFESTHNVLASNSTISIDAVLTLGAASQTVEVTATAALLQTQSAAVQSEINGEQIQKMELNGRNPIYMTQFLPGVSSTATLGDFNFAFNSGDSFNINGARTQDTLYTIDGAPAVRTRDDGEIIAGVNVDAVQEMQVITAAYSAEYGGASGAQVRIVSKSGTTNFHGGAYEYLRNSAMNANTWSRNLNPATRFPSPFVYNNFGFLIGGPIWAPKVPFLDKLRDKAFFFVNEDWVRYRFAATQNMTVPTALMRQGNFSELLNPSNPYYAGGKQLYVPGTCPVYGAATCVAYPGNIIPTAQLSPNGVGIMNSYPDPTPGFQQGSQNYAGSLPNPENQRKGQINGDFLVTQNNHLLFRRSDNSFYQLSPYNQSNPQVPIIFERPNQTISVGWVWTISPTMINEAHASVSVDDVYIQAAPGGAGYDRGAFGIDFAYIVPGSKASEQKIPTATMPTFSSIAGGPYPSHSSGIIYTASDSLTKVWANHTVKGGFFFDRMGENDNDQINVSTVPGGASNQNGTFLFTDTRTGLGGTSGVGLANLALGLADTYTEIGTKAFTTWRGRMFEEFIQDNWQVTHKLNLDYGLRITTIIAPNAQDGNADYFDPAAFNPASVPVQSPTTGLITLGTGNPYNGIVIPGLSKFPSSALAGGRVPAANPANNACAGQPCNGLFAPNLPKGYVQTKTAVLPRIGIAYQLYPTTVVRMGGGRFVENKGIIDNIFPGGNSPFQPTVSVNNISVDDPGAGLTPAVEPPIQLTTMNAHLVPPTRWNWNVTLQQQLPGRHSSLSIAYVGARGLHNWDVFDINQPTVGSLTRNPGINPNYLRPYRGFASIQQAQSGVSETYESLQAAWNWQFGDGSMFGVAYTWSKDMDNGSNYHTIVPDTYDTSNLWGPSEYDIGKVFIANYLYVLPFFKGQHTLLGKVAGGWQISGSTQFQTGLPCSVGVANDYAGVGESGSFNCQPPSIPTGSVGQFWVQHGGVRHVGRFAGSTGGAGSPKWFATTAQDGTPLWTAPPAGTFNLQHGIRDNVFAPGLVNWNIAMIKAFPVFRENGFEFRAEAYNFPNHPNWASPNYTPTSAQFGEVTAKTTSNPRTLQVGLRYRF
jgi:Carboxypeptidase regulatory-like domain/TonB-dependent Receptor Plug Domain